MSDVVTATLSFLVILTVSFGSSIFTVCHNILDYCIYIYIYIYNCTYDLLDLNFLSLLLVDSAGSNELSFNFFFACNASLSIQACDIGFETVVALSNSQGFNFRFSSFISNLYPSLLSIEQTLY